MEAAKPPVADLQHQEGCTERRHAKRTERTGSERNVLAA
jgi:hypothetical protein